MLSFKCQANCIWKSVQESFVGREPVPELDDLLACPNLAPPTESRHAVRGNCTADQQARGRWSAAAAPVTASTLCFAACCGRGVRPAGGALRSDACSPVPVAGSTGILLRLRNSFCQRCHSVISSAPQPCANIS
eukprot:359062-Chlamydomonas_euryale.AAC.8